jgi:predicted thioesterase
MSDKEIALQLTLKMIEGKRLTFRYTAKAQDGQEQLNAFDAQEIVTFFNSLISGIRTQDE